MGKWVIGGRRTGAILTACAGLFEPATKPDRTPWPRPSGKNPMPMHLSPRANHLQPGYAHVGYRKGTRPEAEAFARRQLGLPMFPDMT